MISLKKFIDQKADAAKEATEPLFARPASTPAPAPAPAIKAAPGSKAAPDPMLLLDAYQAALTAMATHGQRAVPALGETIHSALSEIGDQLTPSASPEAVRNSPRLVEEQLSLWADQAQRIQKDSEKTIRDLLAVVFEVSQSTGSRDEKFSREISDLSDRLRTVAGLESLPQIKRSITENVSALNSCVTRMAEESRESVRKLTSEIAEYQSRLVASERRAMLDPLTGLCNRRGFEQQMDLRIQSRQPFSLLVADLNSFKAANDRHGHLVGDEILRQFAGELKAQFLSEDTVARWGGDEFAAIVVGAPKEGALRAERIRHWVLGEYKITIENRTISIMVDAALGTVAWNGAESGTELFARADKEMYRLKQSSKELALRSRKTVRAI